MGRLSSVKVSVCSFSLAIEPVCIKFREEVFWVPKIPQF